MGTPLGPVVTLVETGRGILDGFVVRGGQRSILIDADFATTTNGPEIRNTAIEGNDTTRASRNRPLEARASD